MAGKRILYCHCAYAKVISEEVKAEVLQRLAKSGVAFDAVADLCEMSARHDPTLQRIASREEELKIAACFPRAVKWLFSAAGAPLAERRVEIHNMRTAPPEETLAGLLENDDGQAQPTSEDDRKPDASRGESE